jgi:hypothetical protein
MIEMAKLIVYWDCWEHAWVTAIVDSNSYNIWGYLREIDYYLPNRVDEEDVFTFRDAYNWEVEEYGYGIINIGSKNFL